MIKKSFLLVLNSAILLTSTTQGFVSVMENEELDTNVLNAAKIGDTNPVIEGLRDQIFTERLAQLNSPIDLEFNKHVKKQILQMLDNKTACEKFIKQSKNYFPVFDEIFAEKGIPIAIKSLAIVESNLNKNALSPKGALGIWQFMPATAVAVGLNVGGGSKDQRLDVVASTQKAADYLQTLYNEYNDWILAIAAYNCGVGNVNKAIKKAGGVADYWHIRQYLPKETQNYIPKFIATNYIVAYHQQHGIAPQQAKTETQPIAFIDKNELWEKEKLNKKSLNFDNLQMLKPIETTNFAVDELAATNFLFDFDEDSHQNTIENQTVFQTLLSFI